MLKIDHRKELKHLFNPSAKQVVTVNVPAMQFLMFAGHGDPNTSPLFQEATEALYAVSYTLKFMVKKGLETFDYAVMPLEGLWWVGDMATFSLEAKDRWLWTLMIMQPEFITASQAEEARAETARRKGMVDRVRFETYHEGQAAQIMHLGPYATERATIEKLHAYIAETGGEPHGKHHEIYLGDPRRTAPEKLKTILRQPFRVIEN